MCVCIYSSGGTFGRQILRVDFLLLRSSSSVIFVECRSPVLGACTGQGDVPDDLRQHRRAVFHAGSLRLVHLRNIPVYIYTCGCVGVGVVRTSQRMYMHALVSVLDLAFVSR